MCTNSLRCCQPRSMHMIVTTDAVAKKTCLLMSALPIPHICADSAVPSALVPLHFPLLLSRSHLCSSESRSFYAVRCCGFARESPDVSVRSGAAAAHTRFMTHLGDVDAELAVLPAALDAHEDAQVEGGPVRGAGPTVSAARVARNLPQLLDRRTRAGGWGAAVGGPRCCASCCGVLRWVGVTRRLAGCSLGTSASGPHAKPSD